MAVGHNLEGLCLERRGKIHSQLAKDISSAPKRSAGVLEDAVFQSILHLNRYHTAGDLPISRSRMAKDRPFRLGRAIRG